MMAMKNSFALLSDSENEERNQQQRPRPKVAVVATQKKKKKVKESAAGATAGEAPGRAIPGLAPAAAAATDDYLGSSSEPAFAFKKSLHGGYNRDDKQKEEYRRKQAEGDPRHKHEHDRRPAAGQ
jgi:hypothetical protein